MAVYTYSRVPAFNPNTSPVSVAKSATGSVYDMGDTGFVTALSLTLVASNTATTTLVSDANGMFPDFTLLDRTQCVFKSGALSPFVLTTTTPIPGPTGAASTVAGPAGPATTDASLLAAGTVADARLPTRLQDASLNAAYATSKNRIYEVEKYGSVDLTGATDSTTAINAAINAAVTTGGTVRFPAGTIRMDSQLSIPYTMVGTVPTQNSLIFEGAGAWSSGRGKGIAHTPQGGTILDLRYNGTGAAKFLTRGFGRIEIRGITFTDYGTSSVPFFKTTSTTTHIHDCAFIGNPSKSNLTCDQDAIILGGTNAPVGEDFDLTDNSPFQGYGTVIENNWFNRIRRGVFGQNFCNGSIIKANTFWQMCGSNLAGGAGIELCPQGGSSVFGNVIAENLMETAYYPYPVKLTYAQSNLLIANNFYDQSANTLAYIRFDTSTVLANTVYAGYAATSTVPHVSEQTTGTNTYYNNLASETSQIIATFLFNRGAQTAARYSLGVGSPEVLFDSKFGALDRKGIYCLGAGSPNGAITAQPGSLCVSNNGQAGGAGMAFWIKEGGFNTNAGWVPVGGSTAIATKTASYTVTLSDIAIIANGATVTITLPDPSVSDTAGRRFVVKNINAGAATVNSAGTSKTIDGAASQSLAQWAKATYVSDGTQWLTV